MHTTFTNSKNIKLETYIADDIPDQVITDEPKLMHILNNLISNAIKFTDEGEVKVEVKLNRRKTRKLWLEFSVSDTGIGIKKHQLENIFNEFQQADQSTLKLYKGTGLGLAIVKMYLLMMDSRIQVESAFGKGSRFWFELPVLEASDDREEEDGLDRVIPEADMKDVRLLIVEDDEFNRMMMKEMLSMWGIQHDEATNGKEAVEMAGKYQYDLILMDAHMPMMDGFEATTVLRKMENYADIPIYAVTADVTNAVTRKIGNNGFTGKILKPYDPGELHEIIKAVIANGQEEQV
jgi:two-component system, sensor histidine kinase